MDKHNTKFSNLITRVGVETLVEFDGASVADLDTNAVIGGGIASTGSGIGMDFEAGGCYFDSLDLAFYPDDRADIEERFFIGLAATWRTPEFHLLPGTRNTVSVKAGFRDAIFENDIHLDDNSFTVAANRGAAYGILEAGITNYAATAGVKHAGTPAVGIDIVVQQPLETTTRAELTFTNLGIYVDEKREQTKIGGKITAAWNF